MATDLVHCTAGELIAHYENGTASPVEVVTEVFEHIEAHRDLNCFCLLDPDAAKRVARDSEARWMKGEPVGRVDGVPTTIKDLSLTKDWPTLRGSKTVDPAGPWDEDAPFVAALRDEGAVLIGKTTTPEFGWKGVTDSPLTGITRNPWNLDRTPGGSSGGAAAACAAFMGPLHQGSDAAGSVRIPGAFCGVFALKPTYGIVPSYPIPAQLGALANTGPITRTVSDAALMLTVMARRSDPRDATTAPVQGDDFSRGLEGGIAGLKIAFSPSLGGTVAVDPSVAEAVAEAANTLARLGAHVEECEPPLELARTAIDVIWPAAVAWLVSQIAADKHELMDPGLLALAEQGRQFSATDLVGAQAAARSMGAAMSRFHQSYDLLLTPQMPLEAIPAGVDLPPDRDCTTWIDWSPFTYPFNLTEQPAATVPVGLGATRLPVGMQIVGRRFEDATVLRAARAYETAHPFEMPEID